MPNQEKYENKEKDEFFEQLKKVEITPLPYFSSELLALPEDILKELRKTADRHNCTVSYVIEHFLEDFLSEIKDISEIGNTYIRKPLRLHRFTQNKRSCLSWDNIIFNIDIFIYLTEYLNIILMQFDIFGKCIATHICSHLIKLFKLII